MASVNKVHILGNVGRDPEVRYSPAGVAATSLSVATSRKWKNKESGETQEETEWHRCVFYDRLAEIVGQYVATGSAVYVEGRLKTRKWTDKEGVERYTTEIVADSIQLLGERKQGAEPRQAPPAAPAPAKPAARAPAPAASTGTGFDAMDSDIPFVTCAFEADMQPGTTRRMRKYHF